MPSESKCSAAPDQISSTLILFMMITPSILYRGWITHIIWSWYAPVIDVRIPLLTTPQAAAILVLILAFSNLPTGKTDSVTPDYLVKSLIRSIIGPPIVLLIAWIAHFVIR